ncbi:MAG: alpha/beta hydrolase [Hyphomonadaceae bacterium]|nr:alpha/beta hydrolase [Hyphomonadaceae bacterium]
MNRNPDRRLLLATLALSACATAPLSDVNFSQELRDTAPDDIIVLWPDGAPGGQEVTVTEEVVERPNDLGLRDRIVRGVRTPTLSVFRPADDGGSAVLIVPGGGYRHVVIDKEGFEAARWFAARGITAYVLRYRLPSDGWGAGPDVALQDAQRAMRVIRAQAGVDASKVALLGFSAGGHVSALLATRFDAPLAPDGDTSMAQPNVTCLMYPVITMGADAHAGSRDFLLGLAPSATAVARYSMEQHARAGMTPTMLVHAADDSAVPLSNTMAMHSALRAAQVRTELHVFEEGGHGFGLRFARDKPAGAWPTLFHAWASRHGVFAA